jgi:hypothetical protein
MTVFISGPNCIWKSMYSMASYKSLILYTREESFDIAHHTFNNLLIDKVGIKHVLCKKTYSICTIRLIVEDGMHEVAHHL